eukprot:gene6176-6414_t
MNEVKGQSDIPWILKSPLYADAFRNNIKAFLGRYAQQIPLPGQRRAVAYVVDLRSSQGITRLHVYHDFLDEQEGLVCDQCRCMGWQSHPVSNSQYHFIIPAESTLEDLTQLTAVVEAKAAGQLPPSFKWTPPEEPADEDAGPYNAAASIFESQDHLLHGVLHVNGFGHLLRMNGAQGGSRKLIGKQLLSVWDRLCSLLRARQVSVEDVSNKNGMLLRVLHTAAFGTTWYGKFGYGFGRGSFNISREQYAAAVAAVWGASLASIAADFARLGPLEPMGQIIQQYSSPGSKRGGAPHPLTPRAAAALKSEPYAAEPMQQQQQAEQDLASPASVLPGHAPAAAVAGSCSELSGAAAELPGTALAEDRTRSASSSGRGRGRGRAASRGRGSAVARGRGGAEGRGPGRGRGRGRGRWAVRWGVKQQGGGPAPVAATAAAGLASGTQVLAAEQETDKLLQDCAAAVVKEEEHGADGTGAAQLAAAAAGEAAMDVQPAGAGQPQAEAGKPLALPDFADMIQIVRDIKHFVKNYQGEMLLEGVDTRELLQQQQRQHHSVAAGPDDVTNDPNLTVVKADLAGEALEPPIRLLVQSWLAGLQS